MREGCIKIGILIVILSIVIYVIKNKDTIFNFTNSKIKNKKLFKNIIIIILIIIMLICFVSIVRIVIDYINILKTKYKNDKEIFDVDDAKIEEEKKTYDELIKKDYENQKYNEPYMIEGFSYMEGDWQNGYVIQDEAGNQYVWVPCTNNTIKECMKLKRSNETAVPFINYMSCYNENYESFLKSALENGGFYISRYELGKENDKTVSKQDVEVITNITKNQAKEIVSQMYDNINCEIINGYAYDTTLKWIKENSIDFQENIIEISKDDKLISGRAINNNIYDFCDNILEYTLENLYDTIVVRGFIDSDSTSYTNSLFSKESRYCMIEEDSYFGGVIPIAIRTILYK